MEPSHSNRTPLITKKRLMLWLNCLLLFIGSVIGPLIMRLYYIHGGQRVWLQSFLQSAAFPILIIPTIIQFIHRIRHSAPSTTTATDVSTPMSHKRIFLLTPGLFLAAVGLGIITGAGNYFYSRGLNLIPVSTSSLILSTQMGFTAVFCFLIVRQKFTPFSVNAVVLLTLGAVVLAMHTSSDRPAGQSNALYLMGFFMTLGASALFSLTMPLVELAYSKAELHLRVNNYSFVLQMQLVLAISATIFCSIGMLAAKDFQAIPKEAKVFGLGERMYYVVVIVGAILWQFFYLGALGVVYFGSSLLCGIMVAICFPITEVLAVIFYKEHFQAEKALSLVLSAWGLISYFYGEQKQTKREQSREGRGQINRDGEGN